MSIVRLNPYFFAPERATRAGGWTPAADVRETADAYLVQLDIPSVPADAVEVSVEDGILILSGERARPEQADGEREHRLERRYGPFSRRFRLPEDADAESIEARVASGVLEVRIAKRQDDRPRRIEVVAA